MGSELLVLKVEWQVPVLVRSHRVCKTVWTPLIDETLQVVQEYNKHGFVYWLSKVCVVGFFPWFQGIIHNFSTIW